MLIAADRSFIGRVSIQALTYRETHREAESMSRIVTLLQVLVVLLLPIGWLLGVVAEYGIEQHPFDYGTGTGTLKRRVAVGAVIGFAAGLLAGRFAYSRPLSTLAFVGMVVVAGLNSWGVMFVVVALNSTSGYGIEPAWVVGTVWSWLLAFGAFFGTAWLVKRTRADRTSGLSRAL